MPLAPCPKKLEEGELPKVESIKKNGFFLVFSLKHIIFAALLWQRNTSESLELSRNCES